VLRGGGGDDTLTWLERMRWKRRARSMSKGCGLLLLLPPAAMIVAQILGVRWAADG
jgi:hypothetical protein